jgi:hypothetical protein
MNFTIVIKSNRQSILIWLHCNGTLKINRGSIMINTSAFRHTRFISSLNTFHTSFVLFEHSRCSAYSLTFLLLLLLLWLLRPERMTALYAVSPSLCTLWYMVTERPTALSCQPLLPQNLAMTRPSTGNVNGAVRLPRRRTARTSSGSSRTPASESPAGRRPRWGGSARSLRSGTRPGSSA